MSNWYPIQEGFQLGEIAPELQGRTQSQEYRNSLKLCDNFVIKPQGSMVKRSGSLFVTDAQSASSRLINFNQLTEQDIVLEINQEKVKVWRRSGELIDGEGNLVADPTFLRGLTDWDNISDTNGIVSLPTIGVLLKARGGNGSYPVPDDEPFRGAQVFQTIRPLNPNELHTFKFTLTKNFEQDIPSSIRIAVYRSDDNSFYDFYNALSSDLPLGEPVDLELQFTPNLSFEFKIELANVSVNQGGFIYLGGSDITVSNIEILDQSPVGGVVEFDSPWSETQIKNLQYAQDTANRELYFAHPRVAPWRFYRDASGNSFFEEVPFESIPDTWVSNNYPSVVETFQGRLWFAASPAQPSTLWASSVGNFLNMKVDSTNPDDQLEFTLITNGQIRWLRGSKSLVIGTDRSEWIGYGSQGIITADDFQFEKQSDLGSINIQPVNVGDQIAFVGLDNQRVRVINFDGDTTSTWASEDISLQADHLIRERVTGIAYARDPDYQLACVLSTGQVAICMHDRLTGLNGWYRYSVSGVITSITASRDSVGTSFWVVVQRGNESYIEIINPTDSIVALLDSYVKGNVERIADQSGVGAFSSGFSGAFDGYGKDVAVVNNMEHFEGRTVQCVIFEDEASDDGQSQVKIRTHPDVYVFNGTAKLQPWAKGAAVLGYSYKAIAQTQRIDGGNNAGTSSGSKRHFNRIFARLYSESAFPVLNGYRPIPKDPDDFNVLDSRTSDDVEIRANDTLNQGVVTIEQDLPLTTEIAAIFGKVASSET